MLIRIADIINDSIVDGPGIRLTVFAQGCKSNCPNCHNPQTHDLNGGRLVDIQEILNMIDDNVLLDGITLSGGEPFLQPKPFAQLSKEVKQRNLNVIAYSGFTWEELIRDEDKKNLLQYVDYLIDGKFIERLKSLELNFRGSSNQRIIDVKKSFETSSIVQVYF